jgi:long-chain acyl-CoA synthetase
MGSASTGVSERRQFEARGMVLSFWARRRPDAPAIVSAAGDRSFAELNCRVNQLVRVLRRRGLEAGDAVALICGNRPEFAETVYACQRAGYRLTPINWHLTAAEAGYIVDDCDAKALVADRALAEVVPEVAGRAPRAGVRLSVGGGIDGFDDYAEALALESADDISEPVPGGMMMYTSGTTGAPKGVYRALASEASPTINIYGFGPDGGDVSLCTGPLYHAAPLAFSLMSPHAFGATVVLMGHWSAEESLALIESHGVTHTHMVPTMFHRLLSLPGEVRDRYDLSTLRYVLHGAAPCPVPVKRRFIEWLGPIVWEYYAATEGIGSFVDSPTWLERPGTVGRPLLEGLVMIGDDTGRPLPVNTTGLVYLRPAIAGPFEYYKDPDKTSSAYRGEYFTLGDVGHLDDDGYLFLTDRSANLIISGGVNIYPAEVDAVLLDHPAVGDVATIGVPSDEWGEEVLAVVEVQVGVDPTPELAAALIVHCRASLAHFKCPRSVEFVDALPRQDNGKIYKRVLRDRFRAPTDANQ